MIGVRMRRHYGCINAVTDRGGNRVDVRLEKWPGVYDRDMYASDNIRLRAIQRHRGWIVGADAANLTHTSAGC
jgi:hypothetical protein